MASESITSRYTPALFASIASICTSAFLCILKTFAWIMTGSTTVMASLMDSLSDVAISFINFISIRKAMQPADYEHRFGHGKIEGLAALLQATFLAGAGIFVLIEAYHRFFNPVAMTDHGIAAIVIILSILLTAGLIFIQNKSLQRDNYLAVEADKAHYTGDIASHLGVLFIIGIDYLDGPNWIDPLGAVFITVYLYYTAWCILHKGIDMLLDREVSPEIRDQITQTVCSHERIHGMHDLRTQRHGIKLGISFDVEISPDITLKEAHTITKEIEKKLLHKFPNAEIMIHKDPVGETEDSRHHSMEIHHT